MTNRKSHTGFELVQLVTLNYSLERPYYAECVRL